MLHDRVKSLYLDGVLLYHANYKFQNMFYADKVPYQPPFIKAKSAADTRTLKNTICFSFALNKLYAHYLIRALKENLC